MNMQFKTAPAKTTPGEILKTEYLETFGMTVEDLAAEIDFPVEVLNAVIENRDYISETLAGKLSSVFGNGPNFWQNLSHELSDFDRLDKRYTTLVPARIMLSGDDKGIRCVIRDISKSGMRILVGDTSDIPDFFTIKAEQSNKVYSCEAVWRRDEEIGVRFVK